MKLGLSTGIFHKFYGEEELNRKISHLSIWDPEYIEILYIRPYMLDIPIGEENKFFLNKKKVTIHAPFYQNSNREKCILSENELSKLVRVAKKINALHIVLHPDTINNFKILDKFDVKFIFENLDEQVSNFTLESMENIIKKHGLCFDRIHARNLSHDKIKKLLINLCEIHFNFDELTSFLINGTKEYNILRGMDVPIIIETRIRSLDRTSQVIKKIKEIFD